MIAKNEINENTPVALLTLGQLKEALRNDETAIRERQERIKKDTSKRYVFGLAGIRSLLGVSLPTAHRLKNTILAGAVSQQGRIIVTDAEKALQLFHDYKENREG